MCNSGTNERCKLPEQVFIDGQALTQVRSAPAPGQFAIDAQRRVILGEDPAGRLVEVTTREYWLYGQPGGAAPNVTIEGFTMMHAATPVQRGAIWNWGNTNWTIRNNDLSFAHSGNVFLTEGRDHRLLNNRIHHGGQAGVLIYAISASQVQGNDIYGNNAEDFSNWYAGGLKITHSSDTTIDGNTARENRGTGLWVDIGCTRMTLSNNRLVRNAFAGITYEISELGKVFGNVIWENGFGVGEGPAGAGIYIQASRDTEVYDNVVAWNADGIIVWSENRADAIGPVVNNYVHHNSIFTMADQPWDEYALAWIEYGWSAGMADPASNNRGDNNRYYHANPMSAPQPFVYVSQRFQYDDLAGFSATPGESDARYLQDSEKDQILAGVGVPVAPPAR
jgi:hypothetical protein